MQVPSTAPAGSECMQRLDFETLELFEARQGGTLALDSRRNPTSSSTERLPSMQLSSTPIERGLLGQLLGASRLTPAAHYVEAAAAIRGTVDDERARMSAVWSQLDLRTHAAPRRAYSARSPPHSALSSPPCSLPRARVPFPIPRRSRAPDEGYNPSSSSYLISGNQASLPPAVARLTADCLTVRCTVPAGVGLAILERQLKPKDLVQLWDKKGKGGVSKVEFRQGLIHSLGISAEMRAADILFDQLDDDGGGTLDLGELDLALRKVLDEAATREESETHASAHHTAPRVRRYATRRPSYGRARRISARWRRRGWRN